MILQSAKKRSIEIPAAVKSFATRGLLLLFAWIIFYHLLLKPHRIPDRWLSNTTAAGTAKLLSTWYAPAYNLDKDGFACVFIGQRPVIRIGDPCNALDLMALYIAFIICIPSTKKRMLAFSAAGIVVIFLLNILRCNALTWISLQKHEWLDFAHKYLFTAIVYAFIFWGWILYTAKASLKKA